MTAPATREVVVKDNRSDGLAAWSVAPRHDKQAVSLPGIKERISLEVPSREGVPGEEMMATTPFDVETVGICR